MSALRDNLLSRLTPAEIAQLGSLRIDQALDAALVFHSEYFPRETITLCAVDANLDVVLPPDWVAGWSEPKLAQYPVTSNAIAADLTLTAAVNLSGHRAVISNNGQAEYADYLNHAHDGLLAGLTLGAALTGQSVTVRTQGIVTEPSWAWTPGAVYLGASGQLTQTAPTSGMVWRLGTALDSSTMLWEPEPPIHLA